RQRVLPDRVTVVAGEVDDLTRVQVGDVEVAVVVGRGGGVQAGHLALPTSLARLALDREGQAVVVDPEELVVNQDRRVLEQVPALEAPANLEGRLDAGSVEIAGALLIQPVHRPVGGAGHRLRGFAGDRAGRVTRLVA